MAFWQAFTAETVLCDCAVVKITVPALSEYLPRARVYVLDA